MRSAPDLAATIRHEIGRLANAAAEKALAGEDATQELDRIAQLRKVQEAIPPARERTWLLAFGVGAICLAAVTLAATIRIPVARLELDATTASVSVRLTDPIDWRGAWSVDPKLIRIQNFEHAELSDFSAPPWSSRASFNVKTEAGTAAVMGLMAAAGASLAMDRVGGPVNLIAGGAPFAVKLNARGKVSVEGEEWRTDPLYFGEIPADFSVSALGSSAVPASVYLTPLAPLELRNVQIQDLSFLREQVDAQQRQAVLSELQTGSLTLSDTGEKITLGDGVILRLRGSSGTLSSLRIEPDGIKVRFEGRAERITIGTGNFARDLRPTVLEYLFHQQKVGFLWGAATFLWGLLWSARALFAGR